MSYRERYGSKRKEKRDGRKEGIVGMGEQERKKEGFDSIRIRLVDVIRTRFISLTYKILNTTQPSYLFDLVSIQSPHGHNTRSSPYVTLI